MNETATVSVGCFKPWWTFDVETEDDVDSPVQEVDAVLQRHLVVVEPLSQLLQVLHSLPLGLTDTPALRPSTRLHTVKKVKSGGWLYYSAL